LLLFVIITVVVVVVVIIIIIIIITIIIIIIIIIIIMFMKDKACFLFLNPQDEVGPSISSSVVLFLRPLVYKVW
jgi:hypothetical protein